MELNDIKKIAENRKQLAARIDDQIAALENKPVAAKAVGATATDPTTDDERVVLELKTIWPIVKAVFAFVRPFLVFSPKWKKIVDRFQAGMDVIIGIDED